MRKVFLFISVMILTICISVPVLNSFNHNEASATHVAQFTPIAGVGNRFPVAGQEVAGPDGIVLKAPDICIVGELVRLDARDSQVDHLTWEILPYTEDFEVVDDGRRAFLSARGDVREFLIIIGASKDGKAYIQHKTIVVEGGKVEPGPMTLTQEVAAWVSKVPDYEGKYVKAQALAEVFEKLATKEDVSVEDMLEATAVANSAVLGEDVEKWVPFLEILGAKLDAFVESGDLETRDDYRETWLAIAKGLKRTVPKEEAQPIAKE